MKLKAWRAAWSNTGGTDSGNYYFSRRRETACAYLGKGGLGGPKLYKFVLHPRSGRFLRLKGTKIEAVEQLCKIIRKLDIDSEKRCLQLAGGRIYGHPANVVGSIYGDELVEHFDAIEYPDDYPSGAKTIWYRGPLVYGQEKDANICRLKVKNDA